MITFQGYEYPTREIEIREFGDVTIATKSLSEALIPSDLGHYVSDEARAIDEEIFFFVDDEDINSKDLKKIVEKEVL